MIGLFREKPVEEGEVGPKGFDDYDLRLGDVMRGERATMGKSLLDVQNSARSATNASTRASSSESNEWLPMVASGGWG